MQNPCENTKLLLKGRYRPLTDTLGFLECTAKHAADAFHAWQERTYTREGRKLFIQSVQTSNLEAALEVLLPLATRPNQWLFLDTASQWCAYLENGWRGTDPTPIAPLAGRRCKCRGVRATSIPNIPMKKHGDQWRGSYGAEVLEVYRPVWTDIGNTERSICVLNDGGRWSFDVFGEPYNFEDTEKYCTPRIQDRFTHDMIELYLKHLGIEAYKQEFYLSNGQCKGFLVSVEGPPWPNQQLYSLEEIRASLCSECNV